MELLPPSLQTALPGHSVLPAATLPWGPATGGELRFLSVPPCAVSVRAAHRPALRGTGGLAGPVAYTTIRAVFRRMTAQVFTGIKASPVEVGDGVVRRR